MSGEVTEELRKIYRKAYEQGIWLREFGPGHGGKDYMAAAGSVRELEQKLGKNIDVYELSLGDIVNNDLALPGIGETREKACRNAIREFKKYQSKNL